MKTTLAATVAAALLLAGCTAATALDTKAACDQAGAVMSTFGAEPPTKARYTAAAAGIKAITDKADDDAKKALTPLQTALEAGSKASDADALKSMMDVASASLSTQIACKAAGSTGYASKG